jgi:hypothetical protein
VTDVHNELVVESAFSMSRGEEVGVLLLEGVITARLR